ncbi:hypothetical protein C3L33_07559, partial [Rhododendron williamsianum]
MGNTRDNNVETRSWSDLPHELLSPVADGLGIIDLLGFRGTCKDWRSASSTASAEIESSLHRKPWFLLYAEGNPQCQLYNVSAKTQYDSINIPELEESACLASNHGWLLLFNKGSIFFFCPFSRAKIELPDFPHSEISDHVAVFSAPPTSKKCTLCVINRNDEHDMELNILKRGDQKWDKVYYPAEDGIRMDKVMGVGFRGKCFYFFDKDKKVLTYEKKEWEIYRIVVDSKAPAAILPFHCHRSCLMGNGNLKTWLNLGEDVSISTCGTYYGDDIVHNEKIAASKKEGETRKLKGIWIHPRFLQAPSNQCW